MKNSTNSKKSGFTIIEVVLVLAIAGLIFLIVFLAVPALQRSQRDQARRSDMGRLIAATQDWRGNHQGGLPTPNAAFATQIGTGSSFDDPSGGTYSFVLSAADTTAPTTPTNGQILYLTGRKCATNGDFTATGAGSRNIAYRILLESGDVYCQSN
jgi:prepilin-type N-terminal cleavage/methylation domain-containing protein